MGAGSLLIHRHCAQPGDVPEYVRSPWHLLLWAAGVQMLEILVRQQLVAFQHQAHLQPVVSVTGLVTAAAPALVSQAVMLGVVTAFWTV